MKDKAAGISISKRDAGGVELENAELELYRTTDADGKALEEEVLVKKWTSGKTPTAISEGIITGASYRLHEDAAPAGYKKATDITFKVDKYSNIKDITGGEIDETTGAVVMTDMAADKGQAVISKTSDDSSELIGGAELEVYKAADIGTDGKPVEGAVAVAKWTSEKDKTKLIGDLELGDYVLIEINAPDGYIKAANVKFTVTSEPVEVIMADQPTVVEISKTDITGGEEIADAELQVLDKDGNVIDSWKSTAGQTHTIKGKLKAGETYTLHEEGAPAGYTYAEDAKFTVNADGTTTLVEMKDDVTKVTISKQDITGDKEIAGAKLQVIDKNGEVVESWTSEEGKSHEINGKLIAGETYTLHEEGAPDGYAYASDVTFTVNKTGATPKVVMKDDVTKVTISKQDITGDKEIPGAQLQIIDDKGVVVEEWTSTEPFGSIFTPSIHPDSQRIITNCALYAIDEFFSSAVYTTGKNLETYLRHALRQEFRYIAQGKCPSLQNFAGEIISIHESNELQYFKGGNVVEERPFIDIQEFEKVLNKHCYVFSAEEIYKLLNFWKLENGEYTVTKSIHIIDLLLNELKKKNQDREEDGEEEAPDLPDLDAGIHNPSSKYFQKDTDLDPEYQEFDKKSKVAQKKIELSTKLRDLLRAGKISKSTYKKYMDQLSKTRLTEGNISLSIVNRVENNLEQS